MNLIKWENNRIVISPEAYAIKVFRDIWKADKQRNKDNAIMELGLLYFMYDPRSEYQFETDEEVRLDIIKSQTGIGKNWKPNERFEAAIPVYKYLTITTSSIILETNRQSINTIREILLTPIGEIDESKKFDHAVKMAKTIKELNDLAEQIVKVEKEIHKEVEEQSIKLRGKGSHTIGDIGGAGDIFKGI